MVTFRVYPTPPEGSPSPRTAAPEPGRAYTTTGGPGTAGNVLAALASFFLPGLGQLLQGRLMSAAFLCLATTVGYFLWFLILPGLFALVLHVVAILDAALYRRQAEPLFSAQFS